jgi:hypothetical protein
VALRLLSRFLAKVSLVGRPFRVENGVVVALSTPFLYGPSRPFSSWELGIAPWALHWLHRLATDSLAKLKFS